MTFILIATPLSSITVEAQSSHPNLFVSAENSFFQNHFSGSMVVEVVIRDSDISSQDDAHGEPDVTLNGKKLRMVQASDGNWYAYFANKEKVQIADATQASGSGEGLDFGA
ncbi:MAG TPA: peptidase, partial [Nitrosopumilaceae archaeon]|nr:peptidase [Nitrosopumilaceae archaeon]